MLAAVGLGVTGAYLGTPISFVVMCLYCAYYLRRYVATTEAAPGPVAAPSQATITLWTHVKQAWAPIAALVVIAVLQNIDIIAAKHRFSGVHNLSSSYAATAVAAKVLIWVAIGAGYYLVPEVSRRRAAGEDTRPVLAKALGIILVCAVPVLLIFAFGSASAAEGGVRVQPPAGREFAVHPRHRVHRARRDLSRRPIHAGHATDVVPDPARPDRGGGAGGAAGSAGRRSRPRSRPWSWASRLVGAVVAFGLALRPERPSRAPATLPREPAGFETA